MHCISTSFCFFFFFSSEIIKNIINTELDFYLLQFLGNDQLVMIKKMNSYPEFKQICRDCSKIALFDDIVKNGVNNGVVNMFFLHLKKKKSFLLKVLTSSLNFFKA